MMMRPVSLNTMLCSNICVLPFSHASFSYQLVGGRGGVAVVGPHPRPQPSDDWADVPPYVRVSLASIWT